MHVDVNSVGSSLIVMYFLTSEIIITQWQLLRKSLDGPAATEDDLKNKNRRYEIGFQ